MFLCWRINSYPITYGISKSSRAPNPIIRASPLDGCRHRVPAYAKFPSKRSFALARLIAPSSLAYLFIGKNPPAGCSLATEEFPLLFCYRRIARSIAPKNVALTMYKNQFDDPLLLFEKRNQEKILMFLSDVYGYYTADLLNHPSVVRTLINVVDTILKESQFILRIAEARGNISFTVSGEGLVAPSLAVYKDNRFVAKKDLSRGGFHTFSASFELAETGEYIAQISSHGVSVSRIPFFFNGSWQGRDIDSVLALQRYRTRVFKSIQAEWFYLVIFFISSLYVTFRARRRGIPGERL